MQIPAELKVAFEEAEQRDRFWADNYSVFLERYPEQMVAVRDGRVIAAAPTLELLLDRVRSLGLSPHGDVWLQWISKSMACLVL